MDGRWPAVFTTGHCDFPDKMEANIFSSASVRILTAATGKETEKEKCLPCMRQPGEPDPLFSAKILKTLRRGEGRFKNGGRSRQTHHVAGLTWRVD